MSRSPGQNTFQTGFLLLARASPNKEFPNRRRGGLFAVWLVSIISQLVKLWPSWLLLNSTTAGTWLLSGTSEAGCLCTYLEAWLLRTVKSLPVLTAHLWHDWEHFALASSNCSPVVSPIVWTPSLVYFINIYTRTKVKTRLSHERGFSPKVFLSLKLAWQLLHFLLHQGGESSQADLSLSGSLMCSNSSTQPSFIMLMLTI